MRIAFILDKTLIGGAERHTLTLAGALTAKGHEVEIIVILDGGSPHFPGHLAPTPLKRLEARLAFQFGTLKRLGQAIEAFDADVVLAVNQTALVATWLARRLKQHTRPTLCVFHTTLIGNAVGKLKLPIFKACVRSSDGVIYVSENQKRYWDAQNLLAPLSVAIPNGIDIARFTPPSTEARKEARDTFGFAADDVVIALCARFAPEKNHGQLIEALARLAKDHPRFKVLLIGDGPTRPAVEALVDARGLRDRVVFTGELKAVASALAAVDAGVLVSTAVETFSLAALELMATGLPVVLSDIGGASEMVADDVNGFLFPASDTHALVSALLKVEDDGQRARLGAAARDIVARKYTVGTMTDAYEAIVMRYAAAGQS